MSDLKKRGPHSIKDLMAELAALKQSVIALESKILTAVEAKVEIRHNMEPALPPPNRWDGLNAFVKDDEFYRVEKLLSNHERRPA